MIDAVLFDLDGTLVDTPQAITEVMAKVLLEVESEPSPAAIRATIGRPLESAFEELMSLPSSDARVTQAVERYKLLFSEIIVPKASELVFPGVFDGLGSLRDSGIALAVATSKIQKSANLLLEAAGIHGFFSLIVGTDQVARPKPAPDMAENILRELRFSRLRAVMVGDTTHDLKMAKAAELRSIAVTYGVDSAEELAGCQPDYVAQSFDQVVVHVFEMRRSAC